MPRLKRPLILLACMVSFLATGNGFVSSRAGLPMASFSSVAHGGGSWKRRRPYGDPLGKYSIPSSILQTHASGQMDTASVRQLTLAQLLEQVNQRGIRFAPTTSRQDLERLLILFDNKQRRKNDANDYIIQEQQTVSTDDVSAREVSSRQSTPASSNKRSSMPLHQLLAELDRRNIRYTPTATRQELEQLLKQKVGTGTAQLSSKRASDKKTQQNDSQQATMNSMSKSLTSLSIAELLEQLDSLGIRYPPIASSKDLRILLQESYDNGAAFRTAKGSESKQRRKRRRQRARLNPPSATSILGSFLESSLPQKATKTVSKAIHRAKLLSRKANDYLFTDEAGVRDVAFEYVRRDDAMAARLEKAKEARRKANANRAEDSSPRKRVGDGLSRTQFSRSESRPLQQNGPTKPMLPTTPLSSMQSVDGSVPKNAKFRRSEAPPQTSSKSRTTSRQRSQSTESDRKIYSPYAKPGDYKDSLDLLGDLFADTADRIMWGSYDTINTTESVKVEEKEPRHWKDRLEERFDYMLGIHEDGEFYNRWTGKMKDEQRSQGGFDAFSVARGKQPKRRGVSRRNRERMGDDKPIWEQDNLVSLLFGQAPSGRINLYDKIFSSNGSILNLFSTFFKSVAIISSYLCRWASCRGALPQPIVVVGMSTAAICARPRYRFKIVVLTLIIMRAMGELLHGYVYGSDGWEDDEGDDDLDVERNQKSGGENDKDVATGSTS